VRTANSSSTWLQRSEERLSKLLSEARQRFDSQSWDVTGWHERPSVAAAAVLTFSVHKAVRRKQRGVDSRDALPPHFIDTFKAWMVLDEGASSGTNFSRLFAAKHFWHFLSTAQAERADDFKWGTLIESDFLAFEQYLKSYCTSKNKPLSDGAVCSAIFAIQELANFLWLRGICRSIKYIAQTKQGNAARPLSVRETDAKKKLPDKGALETLAEIYHRTTTAPPGDVPELHLIYISAAAIQPFTGFRPIELLTLPYDCEVEEKILDKASPEGYRYQYGLRYWVAKKGRKSFQTKWISRTAEPLVRECIKRIKDLTAEARRRAVILEADPTRVPLSPDLQKAWVLAVADVAEILGYKTGSGITRIPEAELPRQRFPVAHKRMWFYYPRDVELYLMRRRVKNLYTVRYEDNTIQKLSESLFITFAQIKSGVPCRLLVEPITYKQLHQFFSRPTSGSSDGMFTLYGKTPEEKAMAINLNSFRHWLHHVAYKGGLQEHLLARYFARDNPQSSRPYLHFTPPEIAEYVRDEIRAGRVFGNIAKTYWSLPEDQREDYLLGQVNAGHITPWGLCARNFALKPCDKHLNCLNNCSSFLCTKGDQREVSALIDLQRKTAALLKAAEDAEAEGEQWAKAMVGYNAATLANIDVILTTHMSPDGKEGEMIRPFKEGISLAES